MTLERGANSVFAVALPAGTGGADSTGGSVVASSETYPVYLPLTLTDIAGHWAEQYVKDLVDRNVITGYDDNTFRMQNDVTRAEFCALIVRALGLTPDAAKASTFADYEAIPQWGEAFRRCGGRSRSGEGLRGRHVQSRRQDNPR